MPWHLERRDDEWCVIRETDGFNQGCHSARTDAVKQLRALYAQEDNMTADGGQMVPDVMPYEEIVPGVTLRRAAEAMRRQYREKNMIAASAPIAPPRAWFETPEADRPTPISITADGQVYGHLALWDTCHTGFRNGAFAECVQAPRSPSGYQFFHLGQLETDNGMVAVGKLTYGTGHAPLSAGLQAASSHYDNTGSVGAFVRASDGRYGIWLAGAVRSDLPAEGVRDLRANPQSGDWREFNGRLELVASLAVVVPGFPIPRPQLALSASGLATLVLPGVTPAEADSYRSKEYLRRRYALSAAANDTPLPDVA